MFVPPPSPARRRPIRARLAGVALATAALALLVAGCFRTEISIEVNEDGSGTLGFLVAMDRAMFDFASQFDDEFDEEFSPEGLLDEFDEEDLPPGSTVEPYEENNMVGVNVTVPFERTDDVAATLSELLDDGDDPFQDDDLFQRFVLERDGDRWIFEAEVSADDDEFGDPAELGMARAMFDDDAFTMRLKLPGDLGDHNADEVTEDGTLIWILDFFDPATQELHATSEVDGGTLAFLDVGGLDGTTVAIIIALVVAVLVVIAGALAVRSTRD